MAPTSDPAHRPVDPARLPVDPAHLPVDPARLPVDPAELPVEAVVPELLAALEGPGMVVLEAPPGAGKTTRVPLALLDQVPEGRIVVLEPRRVAARAAAMRLAMHLAEPLGERVGLTTRDERRTSPRTRIEVVTEGVLLRRLQRDPSIGGTALVMFDEFHERNLEGDLSLAFTLEARAALRPDLRVLVASATLDGDRVVRLLGNAPVIRATGREYRVEVSHRDRPDVRDLDVAVRDAVTDLLADGSGDVLVFLPGVSEIRRAVSTLAAAGLPSPPLVLPLHGSLSPGEQDAALAPAPPGRRKVVLATDLAESSITIDGVTAVVDAGLSREPRFDAATGMTGLVTVPASRASADQRSGRAGRTAPGVCIRLWPEREHAARDAHPRPAIATDDLTGAVLEVANWGAEVAELALLDQPPDAGWARGRDTLRSLGGLDDAGRITAHGRELAELPVHPRIAQLLLRGREVGLGTLATEVAAVLADRDPVTSSWEAPCADLAVRVRVLRGGPPPAGSRVRGGALARTRREQRRLARLLKVDARAAQPLDGLGGVVLAGWPERLAAARPDRRGSFLLAGGRGAELPEADVLAGEPYLAVAHLDRGQTAARIFLAAAVDGSVVREMMADHIEHDDEVAWRDGDVVAERRERLGAIVLHRERLHHPDPDRRLAALLDGLVAEGLDLLGWTDADRELQARVALVREVLGDPWPDLSDEALLRDAEAVFGAFLLRARRRRDLSAVPVGDALRSRFGAARPRELDRLAPTHLEVPSGSSVRLDYRAGDRPVLAVRVQEMFGARSTPTVVDGRVPVLVHLLSPARRPVQVTDDLAGFWERTYPQVRAELRGRYPKHAWPEDPLTAPPLRGTKRRPRRG
jgi:ATP-dependent helicase HrpB